jgi:hypothetical protein
MQQMSDVLEGKKFGGYVTVELIRDGKDGPVVTHRETVHNTVVNDGKEQTWRQAMGLSTRDWDQFRVGTCGAAVVSNQTNVLSPVGDTIDTADSKSLLAGQRTMQLIVSYPSGGGSISALNIQEAVVLNQNTSPGGNALMRALFTPVNKTEADKLKLTYNVRIT